MLIAAPGVAATASGLATTSEVNGSGGAATLEGATTAAMGLAVVVAIKGSGVESVRPGQDTALNVASHSSTASSDVLRSAVILVGRNGRCDAWNPTTLRFRAETSSRIFMRPLACEI